MGIDVKKAQQALRSAGAPRSTICSAAWPFGRERRLRSLIRRRLNVLEVKNAVVDFLFRLQKPLADFRLFSRERIKAILADPEQRKIVISLSPSREVIEEELRTRYRVDSGLALDEAFTELQTEGVVLRVPGTLMLSKEDVFLAVPRRRPYYEMGELNRLVREGTDYSSELRRRSMRRDTTDRGRSYEL